MRILSTFALALILYCLGVTLRGHGQANLEIGAINAGLNLEIATHG